MKFNRAQKTVIAITDLNQYEIFKCELHSIYSVSRTFDNKTCPYCKKSGSNITRDLLTVQRQFQEDIGMFS